MKPVLLFLTCANKKEADKIALRLLEKKLVVCTKQWPVSSAYRWKGKIERGREVLLLMETVEEKFAAVEREVRNVHSYERPVLLSVPMSRVSKGVAEWMRKELGR